MSRRLLLATVAVVLAASPARAGVPDPSHCVVDPCMVTCPFGDVAFKVEVHDFANNRIAGSTVVLDFSPCPAVSLCPNQESGTTILIGGKRLARTTGADGSTTFHIHAGGLCPGSTVTVYADGVTLANRLLKSTDQDGDLAVTALDQLLVAGKVGGDDLSADFDCDSGVTSGDVDFENAHVGHSCDSPTPSRRGSWGRLKLLYR